MMVSIDMLEMTTKKESHMYLQECLSLPEYYGHNLDALYDCLTEMSQTEIHLHHADEADGYAQIVLHVFLQAARENPELKLVISE